MALFNYHSDSAVSVGQRRLNVHRPRHGHYRSAPLMNHHHHLLPPSSVEEHTLIFNDVTIQERFHHHHPISSVEENTLIFGGVAVQERFRHVDHHREQQPNLVPVSSYVDEAVMTFDGEDVVRERLFEHSPTTNHHWDQRRTIIRNNDCLSAEEILKCVELKKNITSHGEEEGICVICQENLCCFEAEEEEEDGGRKIIGVISSCGHEFHFDCVAKWLQLKNLCPLCKAKTSPFTFSINNVFSR